MDMKTDLLDSNDKDLEDCSMYGTGTKKMLNMLILDILKEYSDSEHRLLQQDIIDLLMSNYGFSCERRAVSNNIKCLKEMGYDIVADKGYYLKSREFTDAELRLLIDSIFSSGSTTDKEAHRLVKKLESFSNKYFKSHVSHIHTSSSGMNTANSQVMDSIAIIDTAISKGRKISFSYLQYGIDFKLHPKRSDRYVASPYQMVNHRGRYYLIANYEGKENISHFRIDRFSDVEILDEKRRPINSFEGYENGLDMSKFLSEHVYMYGGKSIHVKFRINERFMDNLIDNFGTNFRADPDGEEDMIVSLKSNPDAFFYWALQYGLNVEVLEPESMRERILKACREIEAKYKK